MPPTHKHLMEPLARSLTAFQQSSDAFQVLHTLPGTDGKSSSLTRTAPSTAQQWRSRKLVVLDSSFNPPTRAHASMLRSALASVRRNTGADQMHETRVLLLLAVKNADKAPQPAAFPSRIGMMAGFGKEVHEWEEGHGVSIDIGVTTEPYFHDKALAIKRSSFYENVNEMEQVFLAGFDTLIRVFNPKYYTEGINAALDPFFRSSSLRITLRGDDDWGSTYEQRQWVKRLEGDGKDGLEALGGRRQWLDMVELVDGVEGEAVSSSRVREAVKSSSQIDNMVGEEVKMWIKSEGLYRDGS